MADTTKHPNQVKAKAPLKGRQSLAEKRVMRHRSKKGNPETLAEARAYIADRTLAGKSAGGFHVVDGKVKATGKGRKPNPAGKPTPPPGSNESRPSARGPVHTQHNMLIPPGYRPGPNGVPVPIRKPIPKRKPVVGPQPK